MNTQSIPASQVVDVIPNVLTAGGTALDIVGLMLTTNYRVPIGAALSFATAADVGRFFGSGSPEKVEADVYFSGYNGRSVTPDALLFAQFNTAAAAAWLQGGDVSALTLTQLQAIPAGTLSITVNGTLKTSASINLSAATSFSNAATLILAAFTTPGFGVTYDSVSGGFLFTNTTTGATSTITVAAGTNALQTNLALTTATGAVLSQGAAIAVPNTFMDNLIANVTQNWVTFMTLFNPDVSGNANKLLFAQWTNAQNNQYCYVCWDTDITPTQSASAAGSLGQLIALASLSGTCLIYEPSNLHLASFICGAAASINFTRTNGRITFKFRKQDGLIPSVTSATVANNLAANGYNFYGAYATRNQDFQFFANGVVSGKFIWLDSYINQIWLNNALQLAILVGMTTVGSIPYNSQGYSLIEAFCLDPIIAGLNFGAIRKNVTLSAAQIAEVNETAGIIIAPVLQTRGWYLQVKDATAQVRAARGSPPCTFWYMDGGSIQKIDLDSIEVQ